MKNVDVYDVTLRDGTQGEGVSFSVEDKIRVAHKIDELGVKYIEGGWPGSNDRDEQFFKKIKKEKMVNSKIAAFGSTRRANIKCDDDSNIQSLLKAETKVITLVGKTWDFHVAKALKINNEENLELINDSISYLKERTEEVFFDAEHFFDGYKSNKEYSISCIESAIKAGVNGVILCDTNGGSTPWEIESAVKEINNMFSETTIGIHTHNDSDLGVANALQAVLAGATQIQGTINGYGERCGNANLCSIIANLNLKMNIKCIDDSNLEKLSDVSTFINELANLPSNNKLPFVGKSAFAHKGGIHVSAVMRDSSTYEHVEPNKVGNKRRVLVSDLSGRSNISYKLEELGIENIENESLSLILNELKTLENNGYEFENVDASFELLARKIVGNYNPKIKLIETEINSRQIVPSKDSLARIKVEINNKIFENESSGSGPVNALDNALRETLVKEYPSLKEVELKDYRVRVVSGSKGTESLVRVIIESTDKKTSWSTIGVSRDIVEASWKALIDSFEYKLMNLPS
tara:strand:- start:36662 stop:38224 length:1563 start_codon:yes stop_codon:yes gene_type:complete